MQGGGCMNANEWQELLLLENISFTVGSSVFTSQLSEEDSSESGVFAKGERDITSWLHIC